jgi:hypothetical protein
LHFHVSAATGKQNGGRNNDKSASLSSSIAQRLKQVLHTIISETQVGFMKGRYIGVPN